MKKNVWAIVQSECQGVHRDDTGWEHTLWECKVKVGKRVVRFPYRMGMAHAGEPRTIDVLYSMLADASAGDWTFPGYCGEYATGDKRTEQEMIRHYETWRACRRMKRKVEWLWPAGVPQPLRDATEEEYLRPYKGQ